MSEKRYDVIMPTHALTTNPLTFLRYFLPGVGWVHKGGVVNLVLDIFLFIEREGTTEAGKVETKNKT